MDMACQCVAHCMKVPGSLQTARGANNIILAFLRSFTAGSK